MREENLVNMRPKNKPLSGSEPTRSGAPCHALQQRLQFSTYTGSKVPEWLNLNADPHKGFLRSWVFSPTNFPSSQEAFPSQKSGLAPGKAWHQFSQKYDQISQYSPSYWVCNWVQMRGISREPEDTGLGMEMSQYVKVLFVSLGLLFLFFLQGKQENQTGLCKENQVLSSESLLASASWHLLWHCSTLSPVQGQPSQVMGTAHMMMIRQGATWTSLPHLQPGCCQGPSCWVGSCLSARTMAQPWCLGVATSPLPHLVFWFFTLTRCCQSSLSSIIRGAGVHFSSA